MKSLKALKEDVKTSRTELVMFLVEDTPDMPAEIQQAVQGVREELAKTQLVEDSLRQSKASAKHYGKLEVAKAKLQQEQTSSGKALETLMREVVAKAYESPESASLTTLLGHPNISVEQQRLAELRADYVKLANAAPAGFLAASLSAGKKAVLSGQIVIQEQKYHAACKPLIKALMTDPNAISGLESAVQKDLFDKARDRILAYQEVCRNLASAESSLSALEARQEDQSAQQAKTKKLQARKAKCDESVAASVARAAEQYFRSDVALLEQARSDINQLASSVRENEAAVRTRMSLYSVDDMPESIETHEELSDAESEQIHTFIEAGEETLWQIRRGSRMTAGNILVCTDKRIVIMRYPGHLLGAIQLFSAAYQDIVNVAMKKQMSLGILQVLTAGSPTDSLDPWREGEDRPPNVFKFDSSQQETIKFVLGYILAKSRQARESRGTSDVGQQRVGSALTTAEQIEKLLALKEKGALSEEEFQSEKKAVLKRG